MTYHWYIVRNRQSSRTVLTNRAQRKPVVQPDLHQQSACEEISPSTHIIHLHTDLPLTTQSSVQYIISRLITSSPCMHYTSSWSAIDHSCVQVTTHQSTHNSLLTSTHQPIHQLSSISSSSSTFIHRMKMLKCCPLQLTINDD